MTPVATKVVFLASSALGALTLGATAYLVKNPHGFGSPQALAAEPLPAPEPPIVIPEPVVPEATIIELAPVVVTGGVKRAVPRPAAEPEEPKVAAPCSEWREMGPTFVEDGEASGVRRVRELC